MSGDQSVQTPRFENMLSFGNIVTFGGIFAAFIGQYYLTGYRLDQMEGFRKERVVQTDAKFARIEDQMAQIPLLGQRVAGTEGSIKAITERLDSSFGTFSERLDRINTSVGEVKTGVAVLTQRLDSLSPSRRAELAGKLADAD